MGSVGEEDGNGTTTSLPLFSLPALRNIKHSGNLCSPLHTLASVPFRWEEQPGKPRPSNALTLPSSDSAATPRNLDLPPRLLFTEATAAKLITKTLSPTTVLEGPYNSIGRSISLSFLRKGQNGAPEEGGLLGTMVISKGSDRKEKSLFGSWRRKTGGSSLKNGTIITSEVRGGNFVFPSSSEDGAGDGGTTMQVATMSGERGVPRLSQARSHFWATIYGTFKQAIPKRSTKLRKDAL